MLTLDESTQRSSDKKPRNYRLQSTAITHSLHFLLHGDYNEICLNFTAARRLDKTLATADVRYRCAWSYTRGLFTSVGVRRLITNNVHIAARGNDCMFRVGLSELKSE